MASINVHKARDGKITYYVRVRRKGEPIQTATFPSRKLALEWAKVVEGQMIEGRHFPTKKPQHMLQELLDRYVVDILPRKTEESQGSQISVIRYWNQRLGHMFLSDIQPSHIIRCRDEKARQTTPATVVKYLNILSHVFTTAIKEYQWMETNPCSKVSRPSLPQCSL